VNPHLLTLIAEFYGFILGYNVGGPMISRLINWMMK
jgi:hypothetical protein